MNKQEVITRLHETSQALEQLAQHLSELESTQTEDTTYPAANMTDETDITDTVDTAEKKEEPISQAEFVPQNETESEMTNLIIETTFEPIDEEPAKKEDEAKESLAKGSNIPFGSPLFNQNNNPFAKIINNLLNKPLPNANNLGALNPLQMLTGGLPGGLSGLPGGLSNLPGLNNQSLPATLAELHDNPQLLGMIKNVSNNPQMLNMLSVLTGQDAQTLQQTLQSLQPNPENNIMQASAQSAVQPNVQPTIQPSAQSSAQPIAQTVVPPTEFASLNIPNPIEAAGNLPATPYLDSLLAEWHWQPYARAWNF